MSTLDPVAVGGPSSDGATATPLPPWSLPEAEPGRGWQSRPFPAGLSAALELAGCTAGAFESLVMACWIAVLSRCTGEPEVRAALVGADGNLSCVTGTVNPAVPTWAQLSAGLRHRALSGRAHSAVDVHQAAAPGIADLVIAVDQAGQEISVGYDCALVSHQAADRVLGYLRYALSAAVDGTASIPDLSGMLGEEERRRQLEGLAGPRVNNGPDGFVAAFRARAAMHPSRPALHHRTEMLSYGELDQSSERLALWLRAHGVVAGMAVAVVSDRHLDWIVAMLGVLKAGGVYLPVRPDFPPARVADQLIRAECRVALTDVAGGRLMTSVAEHWQGLVLRIDELRAAAAEPGTLAPPELADPAYVYFTSGSTGRPKGAICEHAGMINHLWAKVDDHGLGPDDVVTQTASQCFDISLWQVCAPLLVGGQSVIVDTGQQLDVEALVALLGRHRVTTIQIVPSYLEVLLAHLEAGSVELPRLTSVSVTGEALKASLVRRWFAVMPGVKLINAYGATEVSDDTMHEVLTGPPRRDLTVVNVGRPLRNMRVYVVDHELRLVPEGARGEIVFAGVCVGAGYMNDPERTAEAFGADPYHPRDRLYRSGDLGRWLPEGRLEFLGRRDDQLKIRGLRVEIGDVQAALSGIPGISGAAVVPVGEGNGARLVAFYVSDYELASVDLHDLLSARLPQYMVPAHHFRLPELPLNENGKVDKQRLRELADELASGLHAFEPPASENEQVLATLWAEVLGMAAGGVGRHDDFFDLGGTSLSAIRLLIRLSHRLAFTDMLATPVLKDQARLLELSSSGTEAGLLHELSGPADALPVLVCFPDGGGNAINFRPLADAAAGRAQVLAVEFPGHDLARPDEDLLPLPQLAEKLAGELAARPGLYLWGQGAGAAAAVATARVLEAAGTAVGGVVVAWDEEMPAEPGAWAANVSDDEVAGQLRRRQAYVEVAGAASGRQAFVARAYRHDWSEALHVVGRLAGDPGIDCPVIELTLGSAPARLGSASPRLTRRRLPDLAGDVARLRPGLIVEIMDGLRAQNGA